MAVDSVNLADTAAALAAALDLKVVTLLTTAMRTVDANGRRPGELISPAACYEPRRVIHPEPCYAPRRVIHPTPVFRPRPVEATNKPCPDLCPATAPCAPEPPKSRPTPSPIQPPWAVLPWPAQRSCAPAKVVKVLIPQPDNTFRGTILDRFL